jgi:hypothetical protein
MHHLFSADGVLNSPPIWGSGKCPKGRPPHEVRRYHASFSYRGDRRVHLGNVDLGAPMANQKHLGILRRGADHWSEWRTSNPRIRPNLDDFSLEDIDLSGLDLSHASLRHVTFRNVKFGNCDLSEADLREAALSGADLSGVTGFLEPQQLAGSDLTGAKLPDSLRELFENLDVAKGVSANAQKLFIAMLAACLYSWLTIATTSDVNLIVNRATSPLPIIGTSIPIVGFYFVAPLLLVVIYCYFHLYLQKLWDEMGSLPAIFPDGRPLQAKADPWLLSDLVRSHVSRLMRDRPFLSYLQKWISIALAWWVVPFTLTLFWGRYLRRHDMVGTTLHCVLTAICITLSDLGRSPTHHLNFSYEASKGCDRSSAMGSDADHGAHLCSGVEAKWRARRDSNS